MEVENLNNLDATDFGAWATKIGFLRLHGEIKRNLRSKDTKTKDVSNEELFEILKKQHVRIFGVEFPVKSWDSFRKFRKDHKKEIFKV